MIGRRTVLAAAAAAALPRAAHAQRARPLVAVLAPHAASDPQSRILPEALRALGYEDGRTITLVFRHAEHDLKRLPALAAELVALRPDVLFTNTTAGALAAAAATTRIPIVVSPAGEDVMTSLATNFARPSGNVTGTTVTSRDQAIKCLQVLKEAAPRIGRVALLVNPDSPGWRDYPAALEPEVGSLGLELIRIDARGAGELDAALARAADLGVSALFGPNDSTLAGSRAAGPIIHAWCRQRRLPSAATNAGFARDGGLVGFGTNIEALTRRGADYIHRILRGAKPADLPVERPTRFDMVVNLATARAIGLTLPATFLQRADEVIE